ncbi:hypothetical protein NUW58_g782 [Xylaria curta]|uniref:Uncharacterized protein n=1 Tax=Xylaria curta TaxID=42375 RepID=A0ACC1PPC3_9PEZI|nr:hypothetical protein NUW58_g782 [Xylaria curta]
MRIDGVMAICPDPFRFYALPAEVRLIILENTDLLTPTGEVRWGRLIGYKVPAGVKKGSWQSPSALFLVSKAFYTEAREIFLRNNHITVQSHVSAQARWRNMFPDYAATTFFTDMLMTESFRHLRHLELPALPEISSSNMEAVEQARSNWFQALQRVYRNGGLDDLRFLYISGRWDDGPIPSGFVPTVKNKRPSDLVFLRTFVRDRVWPMISPEHGPPRLPRQLLVEINGPKYLNSFYSIRQKEEQCRDQTMTIMLKDIGWTNKTVNGSNQSGVLDSKWHDLRAD